MKNLFVLQQQAKETFDVVKCQSLIEQAALVALRSMDYDVKPMSQLQESNETTLSKVA
ncbi:hypothetical protein [Acinetobacter junii]|uniref:hypothetical protein n=1 Tax=Acinetobacter junii TaxID=40215 RepID=UPI00148CBBED|nr:hypothetical protein [Acinetobacter junii]